MLLKWRKVFTYHRRLSDHSKPLVPFCSWLRRQRTYNQESLFALWYSSSSYIYSRDPSLINNYCKLSSISRPCCKHRPPSINSAEPPPPTGRSWSLTQPPVAFFTVIAHARMPNKRTSVDPEKCGCCATFRSRFVYWLKKV